jgi:stage V sporulation protein K
MITDKPAIKTFNHHYDNGVQEFNGQRYEAAKIHLSYARNCLVPIARQSAPADKEYYQSLLKTVDEMIEFCQETGGNASRTSNPDNSDKLVVRSTGELGRSGGHIEPTVMGHAHRDRTEVLIEAERELNSLVGSQKAKELFEELKIDIAWRETRASVGLTKDPTPPLHIRLTGSPGTGKTTIGKLTGQLLYGMGYLASGHTVAVSRENLVEDHIGGSEKRIKEAFEAAKGGVLFIDEVYALANGGDKDFGRQVIDVINNQMELARHEVVVVVAGYEDKMEDFLSQNAGLAGRLRNKVSLKNLSSSEMTAAAKNKLAEAEYFPTSTFFTRLNVLCSMMRLQQGDSLDNGRFVRDGIVAGSIKQMARRVFLSGEQATEKLCATMTGEDVPFTQLCGIPWSEIEPHELSWELRQADGSILRTMDAQDIGQWFANLANNEVLNESQPELTEASKQYLTRLIKQVN